MCVESLLGMPGILSWYTRWW